jgi:hypothetical protein
VIFWRSYAQPAPMPFVLLPRDRYRCGDATIDNVPPQKYFMGQCFFNGNGLARTTLGERIFDENAFWHTASRTGSPYRDIGLVLTR